MLINLYRYVLHTYYAKRRTALLGVVNDVGLPVTARSTLIEYCFIYSDIRGLLAVIVAQFSASRLCEASGNCQTTANKLLLFDC